MYDFTWKSFFKFWLVLAVPSTAIVLFGGGKGWPEVGPDVLFILLSTFGGAGFLYIAFAPFIVAYLEAYRDERQRGKPIWYCALCGLANMFGLLLVLVPVGILMVAIYVVVDAVKNGMSQHWFTAGVLAVLSVLCAIGFYWDVIAYRLQLNKLRVFKPSDSRKIMRK